MYVQVRVECQSLRERLKVLQDTQQHDVGTLEDRIAELQLQLDEVRNLYHAASLVLSSPPSLAWERDYHAATTTCLILIPKRLPPSLSSSLFSSPSLPPSLSSSLPLFLLTPPDLQGA